MSITRTICRSVRMIKSNAPKILTIIGMVGVPVAMVEACKETRKLDDVLDTITIDRSDTESLIKSYVDAGVKLAKLYAPSAVIALISEVCMCGSYRISMKQNLLLAATCKSMEEYIKSYRENNITMNGEEADRNCMLRYRKSEYDVEDKDNPVAFRPAIDCYSISDTARFFDEYSERFDEFSDKESRMQFVLNSKKWVLRRLKRYNYVTAYDYYEYLGIPNLTDTLKLYGWEYGDEVIINDWTSPHMADFINLREKGVLLDPNFKFMPPVWSMGLDTKLDEYQENCLNYWKECNYEN